MNHLGRENRIEDVLIDTESGKAQGQLVPALLWFCLLVWVARVTVFIRQRGDFATVDLHAGVQIAVVLFIFLVLLLSARVAPMWSRLARTSVRLLFLYYILYILSAISALWSSMPSYTPGSGLKKEKLMMSNACQY